MQDPDGSGLMFDRIAHRYDLLNRVMSLGLDGHWRRKAIAALQLPEVPYVLDLATGTGDVALELLRQYPKAQVTGVDPSSKMIEIGRNKVQTRGLSSKIRFELGDGTNLSMQSSTFDGAIMAFGIRNVHDRLACLKELRRVVRPQGRIAILELTEPDEHPLAWGARLWKRHVVPVLGSTLSSTPEYAYLEKSIRAFPASDVFAETMREAGLVDVAYEPLTMGAVTVFAGTVPQ